MAGLQTDPEKGPGLQSLVVRCGGVTGTVALADDGSFSFNPKRRRSGFLGWLASLLRPVRPQFIPADQLLGASLEAPCVLTVWFASESTARMGCVTKRLYRARHTPRFETSDPQTASQLVTAIRRRASWWGRASPPHVAAVINPTAGRGGAVSLFRGRLLPLLRDVAGLRVSEFLTAARGHATELVRGLQLNVSGAMETGAAPRGGAGEDGAAAAAAAAGEEELVDCVMFVGGDGTLHEGLQGLFQRPDWAAACGVPLMAVPCGSGNGVAASSGLWDVTTAAVALCRGRTAPIDVASVLQPPHSRYFCLLSVVYGAMANLDIGTDHWRWMGEMRFHLGGLREILRGRCYNCRVFALPPEDAAPAINAAAIATDPPGGGGPPTPVAAETEAGCAAAVAGGRRAAGAEVLGLLGMQEPLLLRKGAAEHGDSAGDAAAGTASAGTRSDDGDDGVSGSRLSQYPAGPPLPLLSQLPCLPARLPDSPAGLPRGWRQLPDSFAIFGAYNTQYLALGARANPGGRMGDGAWEVWQLEAAGGRRRAGAGLRLRCLRVLLGVEDGSFTRTPGVMAVTKARALLFEQRDSSTWTVLDGEAVPERPLFLEVHPSLCRLLVSPAFREEPL